MTFDKFLKKVREYTHLAGEPLEFKDQVTCYLLLEHLRSCMTFLGKYPAPVDWDLEKLLPDLKDKYLNEEDV